LGHGLPTLIADVSDYTDDGGEELQTQPKSDLIAAAKIPPRERTTDDRDLAPQVIGVNSERPLNSGT
jgi:hypothetical protein